MYSYSVHFFHFGSIQSIMSTSVLFSPHWSYLVHFGPFCPLQSYSVHSVHLVPIRSIWSYFVHLVHFVPYSLIRSIWITSVDFGLLQSIFVHLIMRKYIFRLKVPNLNLNLLKIYINLKLLISKSKHNCGA